VPLHSFVERVMDTLLYSCVVMAGQPICSDIPRGVPARIAWGAMSFQHSIGDLGIKPLLFTVSR
jgi:hypothetical protein